RLGRAKPGDKTMVDAAVPFREALADAKDAAGSAADAVVAAAEKATAAAEATADIAATMGRARNHGDKSVGTPDPGAISFSKIVTLLGEQLSS
ncbi:MAG: DAK2 domain-containing protein, partial [Brachybacterium tyrofermentans]